MLWCQDFGRGIIGVKTLVEESMKLTYRRLKIFLDTASESELDMDVKVGMESGLYSATKISYGDLLEFHDIENCELVIDTE
jgi:hypothetical protein